MKKYNPRLIFNCIFCAILIIYIIYQILLVANLPDYFKRNIVTMDVTRTITGVYLGKAVGTLMPKIPENVAKKLLGFPANPKACESIARIGNINDGGKFICLDHMNFTKSSSPSCTVYSFGVNFDFSFDKAMARLGCKIHSFDSANVFSMPGVKRSKFSFV